MWAPVDSVFYMLIPVVVDVELVAADLALWKRDGKQPQPPSVHKAEFTGMEYLESRGEPPNLGLFLGCFINISFVKQKAEI